MEVYPNILSWQSGYLFKDRLQDRGAQNRQKRLWKVVCNGPKPFTKTSS
jgi:hypothetical protein